jgi:hypothetical protein
MIHFVLAVLGFILFCALIAKFILGPLYKKYPTIMKTLFYAETIRWITHL